MHLYKHLGPSDPHLPCGAGIFFVISAGVVEKSRKTFNCERTRQKRGKEGVCCH